MQDKCYVIQYGSEVIGVADSFDDAMEFMGRRTGVKIEWDYSDSHGHVWFSGSYSIQEARKIKV